MNEIVSRLQALRRAMQTAGISAYIVPSSDAHLSEYTPKRWQGRSWISGFSGSAGTMLITLEKAALWTDSRYFLQASEELEGSTIQLMKQGVAGTPTLEGYLVEHLPTGSVVAADGACLSATEAHDLSVKLAEAGITLRLDLDLLEEIWTDRPEVPRHQIFLQSPAYSGATTEERIQLVRSQLKARATDATIITMLCELAWVFNIRGYDVAYNPVAVGFGFISQNDAVLFCYPEKITEEVRTELTKNGVCLLGYEEIADYIKALPEGLRLLVDSRRTTQRLYSLIPQHCPKVEGVSILTQLKAIKNPTEIEGLRKAMVRDGVSLTRFYIWLEKHLASGASISEYELGKKLNEFRAKGDLFYGDSFSTIAGYKGHGAIVHYSATPESSYDIRNEGVLLLDSGGQYYDGTTDITRTLSLDGKPSEQLRTDYTLVLKGHIAIATARFPEGTRGSQIDILARKALWDRGLNYGHGTGHGVGHFLNVHEGPQNIRTEVNPTPLEIGMITSNEPGLYRSGQYGIRIENLIVTELVEENDFGRFLGFETVTLCYLDNNLVDKHLLTESEIAWYNAYQERVYQSLRPQLTESEAEWLRAKTLPL